MKITIERDGERQTLDLPEDVVRGLKDIARRNNITFAEAVQQAIAGGNFLEAVRADGGKVLVEKDNQLREVVREPQVA